MTEAAKQKPNSDGRGDAVESPQLSLFPAPIDEREEQGNLANPATDAAAPPAPNAAAPGGILPFRPFTEELKPGGGKQVKATARQHETPPGSAVHGSWSPMYSDPVAIAGVASPTLPDAAIPSPKDTAGGVLFDAIARPTPGAVHGAPSTLSRGVGPAIDWEAIAAKESKRREIPEEEREPFARARTLRQFYRDGSFGLEVQQLAAVTAGTLAASTVTKYRQALNRWERFAPKPPGWQGDAWEGRPLAFITDQHLAETFAAMRSQLAADTCASTWSHLRAILNAAVDVRAIARAPELTLPKADGDAATAKELYSFAQMGDVFRVLPPDLQVAFVVAVNVGPRAVDLFRLKWEQFDLEADRPAVEYVAQKTGKRQRVPLHPVTVAQIKRWRAVSWGDALPGVEPNGPLWPKLTSFTAAKPEESRPARKRNARFKKLLARVGIHFAKPWQVCRVTCNERLEAHAPGVGQFVLGHVATLNARSYREPSAAIFDAVTTLQQPEAFQENLP